MQRKRAILVQKKIHAFLALTLIGCVIFITYQFVIYRRLTNESGSKKNGSPHLQAAGSQDRHFKPNKDDYFYCTTTQEKIKFKQVNDDYCDCLEDGSDEPETDACSNGNFFCAFQKSFEQYPHMIPSNRVNDGICDCCDGSDEWKHRVLPHRLPGKQIIKI